MVYPGFCGSSAVTQASVFNPERTVNFYPQRLDGTAKSPVSLYPCPGFAAFCTLPTSPVRALYAINGRTFAIGGDTFYEVFAGGTSTARGTMAIDSRQPTLSSNGSAGHQIFITSGNLGYIYDLITDTLSAETTGSAFGLMLDGYFIKLDTDRSEFAISDLEDGTTWDAANVAQRTFAGDSWLAMGRSHRELWLFGGQTSEVWYDSGASNFPFEPYQGAFIEEGIAAPYSLAQFGSEDAGLLWLSQNAKGQGVFRRAVGYTPQRISTEPVEYALSNYARIDDAIGWTYQDQGHNFYVCLFPTARACWVYDDTTDLWHERLEWDTATGTWDAYRAQCQCVAFGQHLYGDRSSGTIFAGSVTKLLDMNGNGIRRLRRGPVLSDEGKLFVVPRLTLDLEPGLGSTSGQGVNPQVMLRASRDGGQTWGNERWKSAGRQGIYGQLVYWDLLGQSRAFVPEITMTDPAPWRVSGAYLGAV